MKQTYCCLLALVFLMLCYVPVSRAQSFEAGIGFGTQRDSSNGLGIDNSNSLNNPFGPCVPGTGDPYCQTNLGMGNLFMGFGGDVMLTKMFGVGAEVDFQPVHQDYGTGAAVGTNNGVAAPPLQYRQTFYDFDGIWAPFSTKRASVRLLGGIGGSDTSFTLPSNGCVGVATVCTSSTTPIGSSNHFQIHTGVGVDLMVTDNIFVRPQIDFRYVPGLTDQFGRNTVAGFMVWVGYRFGSQ